MYEDDKTDKDVAVEKVDIKGCEVSNLLKGSYNKPTSHRGSWQTNHDEKKEYKVKIISVCNYIGLFFFHEHTCGSDPLYTWT